MTKEAPSGNAQALARPAVELEEQAILANRLMATDKTVNAYTVRNDRALRLAKAAVCYKNGYTKPRTPIRRLQADALSKGHHSQTLSGNIQLARGELQPNDTDTHHIVSRRHRLAAVARAYLFRWSIGIDDADNGVFLPKKIDANVLGLEQAVPHNPLHSGPYHFEVTDRLRSRQGEPASAAREELRAMRAEMIAGTFPYMRA